MMQMLRLDPAKRLTAEEALEHPWFWTSPLPAALEKTDLRVDSSHEMTTRKKEVQQMPPQQPPRQQFRPQPQQPKPWVGGHRNGMMNGGRDMGLGRPMPGPAGLGRPPTGPAMGNGIGYSGPPGLNGTTGFNGPPMNGGMGHIPPQGYNNNPYGNGPPRPPPMGMSHQGSFPPSQPRTQPPPAPFGLRQALPPPPFALAGNNGSSNGAPPGFRPRAPFPQQPPYANMQNGNGMKRQPPPADFSRDAKRPRGSDNIDYLNY